MQTLKRRTSPCKYKNDPTRFLGEGITFKAKLIGILEVSEARGDKMCQDALNDLKTAIRAAGEHKQRITINISIDGLRLKDEKTGDCLYHHPVHKISFIAQDMSDSRAFGYIFGSPDTGHRFFGIKTDKTASQVVISMRDLFQVVFELKKKEIEMAKHHSDQHHAKYGSTGYMDSVHLTKDENEFDKSKEKCSQLLRTRGLTSRNSESGSSDRKGVAPEAIADLLDLEQGIHQIDKITSSDPFGSLSLKNDPYDPFDDSFSSSEKKVSVGQNQEEEVEDLEKPSSFLVSAASTSRSNFFQNFSPGLGKSVVDEAGWFPRETDSLFEDAVNADTNAEPTISPIALNSSGFDSEQADGKKSPIRTDLFTELDPLGTGRVKPYVDKKDFFQELKNPPKKLLKEMIGDGSAPEPISSPYFSTNFIEEKKTEQTAATATVLDPISSDSSRNLKYSRIDPFNDGDPFEKTDPFHEENLSLSLGFAPVFEAKFSLDAIFDEKPAWKHDKPTNKDSIDENQCRKSPTNFPLLSSGILRVSLPPEKAGTTGRTPTTRKIKSPPNSPEDWKSTRRKCYQRVQHKTIEGGDSPVNEEPFIKCKVTGFESKLESIKKSPFNEKFNSLSQASPPVSTMNRKGQCSSVDIIESTTPDPPPRTKTALFSIKPPPLPPKKLNQPVLKPPARPPSADDQVPSHYDYLQQREILAKPQSEGEFKCMKLKKQLMTEKESSPSKGIKKQNMDSGFPVLLPPPGRKASSDGSKFLVENKREAKMKMPPASDGSILNIKLTQLDSVGLQSLADTLGISSENIYSMTLQDLTKMLANKYMTSTTSDTLELNSVNENGFEVDFESNFARPNVSNANPTYDKYAVFKELIESEKKDLEPLANDNQSGREEEVKDCPNEVEDQERDKYEALRQLSLNAHNSDNPNREDESPGNFAIYSETVGETQENLLPAKFETSDTREVEVQGQKEQQSDAESNQVMRGWTPKENWHVPDVENGKDVGFLMESQLFPLVDKFSEEKRPHTSRESWATFEKSDVQEGRTTRSLDNFNETENSPFSSDGKEEEREIPFHWQQDVFRKKDGKRDVPWHDDDDESWDDYSPKESLYSDESSHEDRSPEARRGEREGKVYWNKDRRRPSKNRNWSEKSSQWLRTRDKWQDETEDEFEETWKKQRERTGSYDSDKKSFWPGNSYEEYGRRHECCSNWADDWEDTADRRSRCYVGRRKRSESDNEYRKRCDSDTSDRECIWTFQKEFQEQEGSRIGKQKQYHSLVRVFRDCPEHCHESRSKHRKGTSQKRPSSATESKKNYKEKMFSSSEYPSKSGDQTYAGKSRHQEKQEFPLCQQHGCKESRYRGDMDCGYNYYSYDRKTSNVPSKSGFLGESHSDVFGLPSKRGESADHFEYLEGYNEKKYKYSKQEYEGTHFRFESVLEPENQKKNESPQQTEPKLNQWASANGKGEDAFLPVRNDGENFADFREHNKSQMNRNNNSSSQETSSVVTNMVTSTTTATVTLMTPAEHLTDVERCQGGRTKGKMTIGRQESSGLLRKSDSINIFSRDKDPFEGDDFFSSTS
ncbi:hypothetical protein RUM44_011777 [Polyplax serrata]|uniref:PID domain-containing protein n=1 Tax=Polyplax serrata TaxID=468196 RepID=A0ABR1ASQ7_POLSC